MCPISRSFTFAGKARAGCFAYAMRSYCIDEKESRGKKSGTHYAQLTAVGSHQFIFILFIILISIDILALPSTSLPLPVPGCRPYVFRFWKLVTAVNLRAVVIIEPAVTGVEWSSYSLTELLHRGLVKD